MRTYSHTLLTWATARQSSLPKNSALWSAAGATLPDLPAALGVTWLWAKRRTYSRAEFDTEVCGRKVFATPDAALHSALPVAAALLIYALSGARRHDDNGTLLAFLIGWAGHIATDMLTHGTDARPLFWPLSRWRFQSPISYRERERHALPFTAAEHALVLAAAARLLSNHFDH